VSFTPISKPVEKAPQWYRNYKNTKRIQKGKEMKRTDKNYLYTDDAIFTKFGVAVNLT